MEHGAMMGWQEDDPACDLVAGFCAILAHPTRMRIFCVLQDGPASVTDLAERLGVTVPNISQHLRLMRDRGAVVAERHGQRIHYAVADQRIIQAAHLIRDALVARLHDQSGALRMEPLPGAAATNGRQDGALETQPRAAHT